MEKRANDELNVNQRIRSNNMTLHPQKTLPLNISPYPRKPSPKLTLTFPAHRFSISNSVKHLGLGLLVDDQHCFLKITLVSIILA